MREKDNINKDDTFYTPNKFLEYKDCNEADEVNLGLAEENRVIYVAMTRARSKLIIIGDHETLAHHEFYKKLYEYIKKHKTDNF